MKLNTKRTILVGLAFLSISAFWQLYDSIIPLVLKNTFHISDTISGGIMAMDNVLALFMLPFFGSLSDKVHTRLGSVRLLFCAGRRRRSLRCCFCLLLIILFLLGCL
ncbi:hypothetical protein [Eisenbergiella tayi]|uniref:hypothetical protein n=1 Tax=Eisenbergiella tayi TaxID=1432052 RepID=UPI0004BA79CD